jgi:flagellar hook-associated protein 1 FlgK
MAFDGMRIGLSALWASQRGLDITGQNISNVNTDGYSRQRVEFASEAGPITPAIHSRWEGTGLGVRSEQITRIRDQFLDLRGYQEHAAGAELAQRKIAFDRIEAAFAEPSDTGVAAQLDDFFAAWDDLANRPGDVAARAQLLERARTAINGINGLTSALEQYSTSTKAQLDTMLAEVNAYAAQVAELNQRIQTVTVAGMNANDLLDQRDLLVRELADRVGATVKPADAGMVNVFVGGTALVQGASSKALMSVTTGGDVDVHWVREPVPTPPASPVADMEAVVGGRAAGYLDTIDTVVPDYVSEIAVFASALANEVNTLHQTGYDTTGTTGYTFFTWDAVSNRIGFSTDIVDASGVDHPERIAASGVASVGGNLDGSLAQRLADLQGARNAYRDLVVRLGVEAQTVQSRVDIQEAITAQVDSARESVAGVNLDEEMANMLVFERAYQAAARYITAVDELMNTLVNSTGHVGR